MLYLVIKYYSKWQENTGHIEHIYSFNTFWHKFKLSRYIILSDTNCVEVNKYLLENMLSKLLKNGLIVVCVIKKYSHEKVIKCQKWQKT